MADPYWRYGASTDRASIPRPALPGYLTSEASTLTSQPLWSSHVNTSDFPQKDYLASRPGAYGADDIMGVGAHPESGYSGYAGGASLNGYPSALGDPYLLGRRDVTPGTGPRIPDMVNERPDSLKRVDGLPLVGTRESNVLFVDGLPSDCSRREVSHLFRPFIGFREIRVVHKEPRNREDKAMVLCFVEFSDAKCALTALEALQGYKFDNKKVNSPALRIQFAHFPFRLPSDGDDQRLAVPREKFQPEQRKDFQDQTKTQDLLSKRCEKCKKPHGDRPCPTLKDGCFKCGKKGHKAKDCMPKELRMCFICQESGHISLNCPQKTKKVTTSDFPS